MIVTLTANPSLDRTVELGGALRRGEVLRATSATAEPGGKGVNVVRAVTAAGRLAVAVLPAGHDDPVVLALRELGIPHRAVPVPLPSRTNLTVTEPDGTTTKINEPGQPLGPDVLDGLAQALLREAAGARWAVLSGSLPPGPPPGWYAELVAALRATACSVAVDTSGAPLAALLAAGPRSAPDLLKPNAEELAEAVGADPADLDGDPAATAAAAAELVRRGTGAVLATLGAQGAVLVTADGAWRASPPPVTARSTVGAGDSALSGYLLADLAGADEAERLRLAVAYGSAAAALPGSQLPTPQDARPADVAVDVLAAPPASNLPHPQPDRHRPHDPNGARTPLRPLG
ncbi:1-phosphofructokinase family hexose kinase [Quadrisphaera sp. DSM 44207]|uniref:1-phosphofructokinase family hexose kinase n=1 Tax=Quadrisphaera sp. DSM 44207 TaxID=1881057 RepID=UPI000883EA69|nr:hexose kinase [Quadrisphaera sp. DSM 44207]SDQ19095.1 1-phosphofructokinase [Quadrisphaera sp. DSM 44207]